MSVVATHANVQQDATRLTYMLQLSKVVYVTYLRAKIMCNLA